MFLNLFLCSIFHSYIYSGLWVEDSTLDVDTSTQNNGNKNTEIDLTRTASPLAGEGFLEKNVFSVKKFDDVVQQSNKNVSSISLIIVEVLV